MSELAVETAPFCHDRPPQYVSSQPSQHLFTSIIENLLSTHKLAQRIDDLDEEVDNTVQDMKSKVHLLETPDWNLGAEFFQELGQKSTEMAQVCTAMAKNLKDRTVHNTTDLYKALSKLDESELQRIYDSLKRHPTWQMRHELAQNHEHSGECQDRDSMGNSQTSSTTKQVERAGDCLSDSSCSCDRLVEILARMDKISDKFYQSLPSHETVNISKTSVDTTAKPTVSFWKRIFKHSAQL